MVTPGVNEWQCFSSWLQDFYRLTVRAWLAGAGTENQPSVSAKPASSSSKVVCGRCRMTGHASSSCPTTPTTADVFVLKAELEDMNHATVAFLTAVEREEK